MSSWSGWHREPLPALPASVFVYAETALAIAAVRLLPTDTGPLHCREGRHVGGSRHVEGPVQPAALMAPALVPGNGRLAYQSA